MSLRNLVRFVGIVIYASYLINMGLLLVMLPWSELWGLLMVKLPPKMAVILDSPAMRGAISAFGVMHLLLVLLELIWPSIALARAGQPQNHNNG